MMTCRSSTVNMVDCGNLRCFQERRLIKKELMTWSKKVPIVVGLETIAEHVGSRRKVRKLFEPFNCLESKTPQDWEPEENCFYCKDRIQLLFDAIEKTEGKEGGGKILKEHPSLRHLGEVLPFLTKFYTSDFGRDILTDIKTAANEPDPPSPAPEVTPKPNIELKVPSLPNSPGKQPQQKQTKEPSPVNKKTYTNDELSAAVTEVKNGKLGTRRASNLYGIPRSTLQNKVFKMETEDSNASSSLSAAEEEINDVPAFLSLQKQMCNPLNTQDRPLMLTDLLQLSSLPYLTPVAFPYFINPEMIMLPYLEETEWERKLHAIRHKHNLSRQSMNHYKVKALSNHKLRPFQYEIIKRLAKERLQQEVKSGKSRKLDRDRESRESDRQDMADFNLLLQGGLNSRDYTPPPTKRIKKELPEISPMNSNAMMQSALYKALNVNHPFLTTLNLSEGSSDSDTHIPTDLGFLGLPTKPEKQPHLHRPEEDAEKKIYDSLFPYENTRIGDTLKDIIVKTISEKVKCKLESADFSGLVGGGSTVDKLKAKEQIMSAFTIPDNSPSPVKKSRREAHSSLDIPKSSGSPNQNGSPIKKTRPKRGQYRKYNSQLLTEAVKAVQRGEMSVHRAGSYYGVPHSTLEYKVKERHLLRQKKIKEQQELKQKQEEEAARKEKNKEKGETKTATITHPGVDNSASPALKLTSTLSSSASTSWLPPITGGVPFDSAAALGLFASGFPLSTPASELLRKLQNKVQSKSESGEETSDTVSSQPSSEGYVYIS